MNADVVLADSAWEGVETGVQALVDRWVAQPGQHVRSGEALVRIVLVKSTMDVAAPVSGRLAEILVRDGENFSRGQPLAHVSADPQ